jgi:hypothetical protein
MTGWRATLRPRPYGPPVADRSRRAGRLDLLIMLGGLALVAAAALEGRRLLAAGVDIFLGFPPLLASWLPHTGPGTAPAVALAVAVVAWGPGLALRMSWRPLLCTAWAGAAAWTLSLALVDGWDLGVAGRLATDQEYLVDVPLAPSIGGMLREFTARMPTDQPVHWSTHVGGHPPGAFLVFLVLERVGLGGGGAAALTCVLIGSSAAVAVAVAVRALGGEAVARRMLPFGVVFPGAVWVGVSADGMFAGVLAWAVALLALGLTGRGRRALAAAAGSGVLLGYCVYLSYGLVLGAAVAAGALLAALLVRPPPEAGTTPVPVGPLAACVLGASAVAVGFTVAGFWWPDGFAGVRALYAASIARSRPYWYFCWANLAALLFVLGPAVTVGVRRALARPRWDPVQLLVAAGLVALLAADVSGLSKGEVERIWLPFAVWLLPATAWLPPHRGRGWLAAQAVLALAVNHLLLTVW